MAAEKVVGGSGSGGAGGGGTSERGAASEEMNGNNPKIAMSGGGVVPDYPYRWMKGDAVPLKRRRVGLSNGGSVSDGGGDSSDDDNEEQEEEEEREEDDVGEDAEEVAAEEYSDDYEHSGAANVRGPAAVEEEEEEGEEEVEEEAEEPEEPEEAEEEEEEDDDQHLVAASMDRHHHRGEIGSNRGRDSRHGFEEYEDVGTEDEGYDEEEHHPVHDSPPPVARGRGVIHREREREIELASSREELGGRDEMEESEDERGAPPPPQPVVSRGIIERGQSSAASESHQHQRHHHHQREVMTVVHVPEKPARGMMDTAKRKAAASVVAQPANVVVAPPPRNGSMVETKPKKERAPAAQRKKANAGEGATTTTGTTRERTRFSTDNKARVTLERAREILAAVKAAMMKDPKQFTVRHSETHAAVENSSSSEDERRRMPMQHQYQQHRHPAAASRPAIHHQQQQQIVKTEEKVVRKRSRAAVPKAEKEPTPRRRKQPKGEVDYHHATEEKSSYHRSTPQQQVEAYDHHGAYKMGHFSTSGAEQASREGREVMTEDHRSNGYSRDDGAYDQQQITVVEKKVRKRRKAKDGEDASATGLCPGSVLRDENWAPPPSPFGLIQESLYKDPWKVLLSCMLLNKTAGRQMHKVIWDLFSLCPDAETAISMDQAKIAEKVYSLGLQNKRAKMIQRFSAEYVRGDWTNVTQLHGIGKYAADAYAIFCQGLWREVEPDDLMLNKYWKWLWETNGQGTAFVPETS